MINDEEKQIIFLKSIQIVFLSVCLFVSNKRQNGKPVLAQVLCGLDAQKYKKVVIFVKFCKSRKKKLLRYRKENAERLSNN